MRLFDSCRFDFARHPADAHLKVRHRRIAVIMATAASTLILFVLSVCSGSSSLGFFESFQALLGCGSEGDVLIVRSLRLPHALAAMVCGCGFAVSGCLYQCVFRNPLASASTLGVSSGAAFGASLAIVIFGAGTTMRTSLYSFSISDPLLVVGFAFACSMVAAIFAATLSRTGVSSESIILVGAALGAMFQGGTALIQYFADDSQVAAVVFWTFGDLGRVSLREIAFLSIIVVFTGIVSFFLSWKLDVLSMGDTSAANLGIDVVTLRAFGMVVASFVSACIVAFVGTIGFVGLIAPHIMRRIGGGSHRYLVPAAAFAGATLLLASDFVARCIAAPIVLPVGAITSFLGAPLLLYLLFGYGRRT